MKDRHNGDISQAWLSKLVRFAYVNASRSIFALNLETDDQYSQFCFQLLMLICHWIEIQGKKRKKGSQVDTETKFVHVHYRCNELKRRSATR